MEAEHREILRAALRPHRGARSLKELLSQMPTAGEDADFAPRVVNLDAGGCSVFATTTGPPAQPVGNAQVLRQRRRPQ